MMFMAGIVFYKTADMEAVHRFYTNRMDCKLWLDQGACRIYSNGNMLIGFCNAENPEKQSFLTFFYSSQEEVAQKYEELKDIATSRPVMNEKFNIFQFFAKDPEGRTVEVQYFNHAIAYNFEKGCIAY